MWTSKSSRRITTIVFTLYRFFKRAAGIPAGCCRFWPTCSVYAQQAMEQNGFICGAWMAAGRVFRCRPGNPGGIDYPGFT